MQRRAMRIVQAEIAVCLPGQPQVRREILQVGDTPRMFVLRPGDSDAGVTLRVTDQHFLATLAGPEHAELEVLWDLLDHAPAIPLWATAHGCDVEASLWDAFGSLVVPDVLARGADAPDMKLAPGRYMLTAMVTGHASLVVGAGCARMALPTGGAARRSVG